MRASCRGPRKRAVATRFDPVVPGHTDTFSMSKHPLMDDKSKVKVSLLAGVPFQAIFMPVVLPTLLDEVFPPLQGAARSVRVTPFPYYELVSGS